LTLEHVQGEAGWNLQADLRLWSAGEPAAPGRGELFLGVRHGGQDRKQGDRHQTHQHIHGHEETSKTL